MSTATPTPARFATAQDITTAVFAGNATITLVSGKSGKRFTYKITQGDEKDGQPGPFFVKVLTGQDNTNDYTYAGIWTKNGVKPTKNSKIGTEADSMKLINWALPHIVGGYLPTNVEVWHTGRCCRCGRLLTVPESVAHGIGPDCAEKMAGG
jgi:hypothetical protein